MKPYFEWKRTNGQDYLFAQGHSRHDLGEAVGGGLHRQISAARAVYRSVIDSQISSKHEKDQLDKLVSAYISLIPNEDMEEIAGMLKGYQTHSGEAMSLNELALQSFGIDLTHQFESKADEDASLEGCTNFAAIFGDGSVIHGQNYDSNPALTACDAFVHTRTHGKPDCFLYRPGGSLGMAMGKNEAGVAMTVSVIKSNLTAPIMTPRAVLVRRAMEQETALAAIKTMADGEGRSPFCYNLIVSDGATVVGSQQTPHQQRICQVKRTLVQSNQYDYADWVCHLKRPAYSKKRQLYSEDLLQNMISRYGTLNDEDLLEILRDEPVICRKKVGDGIGTTTLFLTRRSFGRGNPLDNPAGKIPL